MWKRGIDNNACGWTAVEGKYFFLEKTDRNKFSCLVCYFIIMPDKRFLHTALCLFAYPLSAPLLHRRPNSGSVNSINIEIPFCSEAQAGVFCNQIYTSNLGCWDVPLQVILHHGAKSSTLESLKTLCAWVVCLSAPLTQNSCTDVTPTPNCDWLVCYGRCMCAFILSEWGMLKINAQKFKIVHTLTEVVENPHECSSVEICMHDRINVGINQY